MGDRSGPVPQRVVIRCAIVALATILLCVGGGVAWAAWVVGVAATGPADPVAAWSVPATATTCTDTDEPLFETAAVTWPETSAPRALDYTATINDEAALITDHGTTRAVVLDQAVLEQLFGGLFGGTLTVEVTALLPGTAWTAPVATETLEAGVLGVPPGLTLECTS